MPVTPMIDIVGYKCNLCKGPATHFWGNITICCDCHAGPGQGLVPKEEAEKYHNLFESIKAPLMEFAEGIGIDPKAVEGLIENTAREFLDEVIRLENKETSE